MVSDFRGIARGGGGEGAFGRASFLFNCPSLCVLILRVICFKLLKNGQVPNFDKVRPYWFGTQEFCEY
jgi:hypothetical protein